MARGLIPSGYDELLHDLKERVQQAQVRAALSVNRELILLYWQIGRDISARMQAEGWGAKVVDRLARDLRHEFPEMKGFSPRNIRYMRAFAEALSDGTILQQAAAKLPWFHLCLLMDKVKDPSERLWYMERVIEHGWSRYVLAHQIDSRLAS